MPSWIIRKTVRFEAAHKLPLHDGKCARLHGHSFVATVEVAGTGLVASGPKTDMVADFGDIGGPLKRLVEERLDHYYLNDSTGLENPTSERLAQWMFDVLQPAIPGLVAVEVEETCTSTARYRP